jgi:proton glutamate symport protein
LPKLQLYTKILLGLAIGAAFGVLANRLELSEFVLTYVKPVGTAFVSLISMVVVPLVFASLLVGTASLKDIRKLGRIGAKTLAYYLCTTAVAIGIGLLLANSLQPGSGLSEEAKKELMEDARAQEGPQVKSTRQGEGPWRSPATGKPSVGQILLNIIPANPIRAFVEGQMLQIIFFALLTGICLTLIPPERSRPVANFFEGVNDLMVKMVHIIMKIAPYGVFALIAAVVADFGLGIFVMLIKYALVVVAGLVIHTLIVYPSAIKIFSKQSIRSFFRGIRPAQLIAFSSSSSSATLPVTMQCAEENLGVPRYICSFALPLGATINMDGTAVYQGVSAVFLAQVYGMDLSVGQQLAIVLTAMLASTGTAGTPGPGIVTLAIVLQSIGVPLEAIAMVMGVERILDMCRSVVNITGDASCAVVVASTEGQLGTP